ARRCARCRRSGRASPPSGGSGRVAGEESDISSNRRFYTGAAPSNPFVPEAAELVVVHHAEGLHEGVADRGGDEPESASAKVPGQPDRFPGPGGNVGKTLPSPLEWPAADESPDVGC